MDSRLTRWCRGFIEAGWLAAVIAAPLFFNIHSERVFEPDKLTIVRSIALLMSAAWLVQFVDNLGWRNLSWIRPRSANSIWRMPFVLPVVALVVVYLLSTLFSVVPRVSWAGSYQRLQGTYTTLSYIVIFALTVVTIRRREQVNRLVTTIIITSIPIALYGMIQHFGLDPLPWGGNTQRRIAGHMGNAIFIAAYLIMVAPLTLARILDAFTNILSEEKFSYSDVIRSSIYIFTFAIQLLAIYWSGSRGPMLGLIVGLFAFTLILLVSLRNAVADGQRFGIGDALRALVLAAGGAMLAFIVLSLILRLAVQGPMASFLAFLGAMGTVALAIFILLASRRGWRWLWLSWIILTVIAGAWLILFNVPDDQVASAVDTPIIGEVLQTMAEWKELPTVGRFGRILESEEGTGRVRVLIWQGVLELLQPHDPLVYPDGSTDRWNFLRPLLGYGPESMYVAYNSFYQPELASIEARNASPDRSHNETFDALTITGVLGFLTWQILYLSVFYFGFRWLGVIRSARDRNLLIFLWVAGALVTTILLTQTLGAVYLGVAIPFGSIVGLVVYLIYYALVATAQGDAQQDPFHVDRLIMMGLLAAVVAHYVEIHFGIAIASTRVHFFVYVALMFLVGYLLPQLKETPAAVPVERAASGKHRRRRPAGSRTNRPEWSGAVLASTYVLTLIIGILGFQFMNFVLEGELQSIEDVPSVLDIIRQSLLVNASRDFDASPFIFLIIVLTWSLGILLSLSELARQGIIEFISGGAVKPMPQRQRLAAALLIVQALVVLIALVAGAGSAAGVSLVNNLVGSLLLVIWGGLCITAALLLLRNHPIGSRLTAIFSLTALLLSLASLVTGAFWLALGLLLTNAVVLYLIWDPAWNGDLLPAGIIGVGSWLIAAGYVLLHAALLRSSFIGPQIATVSEVERQVLATDGFAGMLTFFYLFVFMLIIAAAFALAGEDRSPTATTASAPGIAALLTLFIIGFVLVTSTNLRIVQADMVYKRARPLERIAQRTDTPESWEFPVAIYEHAIELAPFEDFYYLFLGAAYLEQASITPDAGARSALLETAESRLRTAQQINPLNTDHTANLARLYTRWADGSTDDRERQAELFEAAKQHYSRALELSPQNSTIWNEYANLLLTMGGDCDAGIEAYEHSLEVDPNYEVTYLGLAGAYQACAEALEEGERESYLERSGELVLAALELSGSDRGAYLFQAAQLFRQAGDYERALAALEELRDLDDDSIAEWQLLLETARAYRVGGDLVSATEFGLEALAAAPVEQQPTVQQFLDRVAEQQQEEE